LVAIYVAINILKFFNNYYWRYIGSEVARDLSVILYNRITRSSLKDYRKISTGEYVSRLAIDCDKFANYALGFSSEVILGIIRLTIQSIVLFLLSPHLLIALLLIVPLYFLFYKRHVNALADTAEMERKVWGDFVNSLTEFLGCILYIRERNAVEFTKRILSKRLKSQLYFRRKVLKTIGVNELIRSILNEITPLTLLTISSYLIFNESLSVGSLLSFITYPKIFTQNVNVLFYRLLRLSTIKPHARRIYELIEIQTREKNGFKLDKVELIELKNISFSYGNEKVLANINLSIKNGENVAIVGRSGGWKNYISVNISWIIKARYWRSTCKWIRNQ